MSDTQVPRAQSQVVDSGGMPTREWYRFFLSLREFILASGNVPAEIADILTRLEAVENAEGGFLVNGLMSILVDGTPAGGVVQISLRGDEFAPGATYYYGTDQAGNKTWSAVADAIEVVAGDMTKDVAADGVTTLGLADVPNGGDGAFQLFFRDAKGRVVSTTPGDSDDVPEGATNLYFTNERAQDAVGSILQGIGDVELHYADGTPLIFANLSAGVLADLALAETALQPGDNVSELTNDAGYVDAAGAAAAAPIQSIVAGTNVTVDVTDPENPIISASGGGGGIVDSVVAGAGIAVDASDPANPSVALSAPSIASLALADSALQAGDNVSDLVNDAGYLTTAPIPSGYIDGLEMVWVSTTALTVNTGNAYIPSSGSVLSVQAAIAKAGLVLVASTMYHVYLFDNAGTPDIEIVTTAPIVYSGQARQKTGDATRRYVGSIVTLAGGAISKFRHVLPDNSIHYYENINAAPFLVLSAGTATAQTVISCASVVPPTSFEAIILANNNATNASFLYLNNNNFVAALPGSYFAFVNPTSSVSLSAPLTFTTTFNYAFSPAPTGGSGFIRVVGYRYER